MRRKVACLTDERVGRILGTTTRDPQVLGGGARDQHLQRDDMIALDRVLPIGRSCRSIEARVWQVTGSREHRLPGHECQGLHLVREARERLDVDEAVAVYTARNR